MKLNSEGTKEMRAWAFLALLSTMILLSGVVAWLLSDFITFLGFPLGFWRAYEALLLAGVLGAIVRGSVNN
jgi:uncharacterized Tic20 family protein